MNSMPEQPQNSIESSILGFRLVILDTQPMCEIQNEFTSIITIYLIIIKKIYEKADQTREMLKMRREANEH